MVWRAAVASTRSTNRDQDMERLRALRDRLMRYPRYFPAERALHIAENSCLIARYFSDSKANSFCSHFDSDPMNCNCGEEATDFAWVWSTKEEGGQAGNIVLGPENRQISFNPEYSSGTASVRGNRILPRNYQHYWEIKLTNAVYGTNIMIGVCTPQCDISHGVYRFCSLLGRDAESWGYSYKGTTQHGGSVSRYGPQWGKGAIVGVHLDTWRGKLEFFLNREPLGIAFEGLRNKDLYPIVASTSAHSGMKLVSSYMFPHSLQFLASENLFKKFSNKTDVLPKDLSLPPGLHTLVQNNYWPFIKYVSLKIGSNRLEYIRWHSRKRQHDGDSTNTSDAKRLCSSGDIYALSACCDRMLRTRKPCPSIIQRGRELIYTFGVSNNQLNDETPRPGFSQQSEDDLEYPPPLCDPRSNPSDTEAPCSSADYIKDNEQRRNCCDGKVSACSSQENKPDSNSD